MQSLLHIGKSPNFTNVIRNLKTQKADVLAGVMSPEEFQNFYSQLEEDGYLSEIKCRRS